MLLTYLWHITLFGGCLAISGYAEAGQKHAITCMTVKPVSESSKCLLMCQYSEMQRKYVSGLNIYMCKVSISPGLSNHKYRL